MDLITNRLLRQAVPLFNVMAGVALVLGFATLLMAGQSVLVPLALAVLLSFALTPIVLWLERIGLAFLSLARVGRLGADGNSNAR